jgi:hypothetical protein
MNTSSSQIQAEERTRFLNLLRRSMKRISKGSKTGYSLMQHQNLISKSLGYLAWNLLVEDVFSCPFERFSALHSKCLQRGLVPPAEDDDVDFDEFWFDGAGD